MRIGNAEPQAPHPGGYRDNAKVTDHVKLELRGPDGKIKETRNG